MGLAPRVAVIGAGISGVVTAAHLKNEGLNITVFERSSVAGGVWAYDEREPLEPRYPNVLPSEAEGSFNEWNSQHSDRGTHSQLMQLLHAPPGPCYVGLKNNVGTRLLKTTLNPFPVGTEDYVSHSVLGAYIQDTAKKTGVEKITYYNTQVRHVRKSNGKWVVDTNTMKSNASGSRCTQRTLWNFDYVVVASGHYHAPRVPDVSGLSEWKRQWPDRVQHSKKYRNPDSFAGKNVLLIGAGVSSTDIARELGPLAKNIYQTHRNGVFDLPDTLLPPNAMRVEDVESFERPTSLSKSSLMNTDPIPATITLRSGRKLCDIHHIIICTGYHITLPFLRHLHSDSTPLHSADEKILVTDGSQIHNLYKDIFYIPDPSLSFVGVPYYTATFTLFEFQAMVVAKVLCGKVALPDRQAMRREYDKKVNEKGLGKGFHSLKGKEVEYVDELLEWVNGDLDRSGLTKIEGHTKAWHEAKAKEVKMREALFAGNGVIRKAIELVC